MAGLNLPNPDKQTFSVSCRTSPSSFLLLPVWASVTGAFWGDFLLFNFSSSSAGISLPSFSSLTYKYFLKNVHIIKRRITSFSFIFLNIFIAFMHAVVCKSKVLTFWPVHDKFNFHHKNDSLLIWTLNTLRCSIWHTFKVLNTLIYVFIIKFDLLRSDL